MEATEPLEPPRLPPPPAEACLTRPYSSRPSQKGGTLIDESVHDLAAHQARMVSGGYRPQSCGRCGAKVYVHERRSRLMLAQAPRSCDVMVFRCCKRGTCGAVWRVLPMFLARHLRRSWDVVAGAVGAAGPVAPAPPVPKRTVRRWKRRLLSAAVAVVLVFSTSNAAHLEAIAKGVGTGARRRELVEEYRRRMQPEPVNPLLEVAVVIHRLQRGVRLM